ncbi:hypothetical protein [Helicobacter sp. MIT 14-3879]|uniref:hypothetical protein n=1 Tax=Helicobacter sp. MIT 14-3879 TaxID=2040649 RepID=UPI000E1FB47A|nr:hypothetical protein [Helicobacter sp. MIT 14-3879]RDU61563.1 hypothetical protein CQA44_08575 [Helicobacter sp. MIT 14-3879]
MPYNNTQSHSNQMTDEHIDTLLQHDAYMQNLQINKDKLNECQKSRGFQSCLHCEQIIACQIRIAYVNAVYESMNKGQVGDFDFN